MSEGFQNHTGGQASGGPQLLPIILSSGSLPLAVTIPPTGQGSALRNRTGSSFCKTGRGFLGLSTLPSWDRPA